MNKDKLDVFPLISICLDIADKVKKSYDTPDDDFNKKFEENIVNLITKLYERFPPDHNNDVTETSKKKEALSIYKEKIEKCKIMVKSSENATYNKTNNDKDGFNILKLRLIEYEKQRIDELNKFVFDLVEIKQK